MVKRIIGIRLAIAIGGLAVGIMVGNYLAALTRVYLASRAVNVAAAKLEECTRVNGNGRCATEYRSFTNARMEQIFAERRSF